MVTKEEQEGADVADVAPDGLGALAVLGEVGGEGADDLTVFHAHHSVRILGQMKLPTDEKCLSAFFRLLYVNASAASDGTDASLWSRGGTGCRIRFCSQFRGPGFL